MSTSSRRCWASLLHGILMSSLSLFTTAQEPRKLHLPAPPPMKFVSLDERSQLTATKDPKSRVRTTIELAETHLKRAENLTSQKRFDQASEELGGYLGLIDDALSFIGGLNRDKGSTRDLYRHLDLALRTHIPRLAVMRRTTPADYSINIKATEEYVRDTRAQALDSFYGHTVLRDSESNTRKSDKTKDSPGENKRP